MGGAGVRKRTRAKSDSEAPPRKKPNSSAHSTEFLEVIVVSDDEDQVRQPSSNPSTAAGASEVLTIDVDSVDGVPKAAGGSSVNDVEIVCDNVVDLSKPNDHVPSDDLYFAVVRGMVQGREWSGVTNCVKCAYTAVASAPKGASSYVVQERDLKKATNIVSQECIPCSLKVYGYPSVQPQLGDVVMYTDGGSLAGNSKVVRKVFVDYTTESQKYAGYGVWFGQDSPFNCSGPVDGEKSPERAELVAVIVGLETVWEKIEWAGRVLVRIDASLQHMATELKRLKKHNFKVNSKGDDVKHIDLWRRFEKIMDKLEKRNTIIIFEWVKGHAMSFGNHMADYLARAGAVESLEVPLEGENLLNWNPTYDPQVASRRVEPKGDPRDRCTKIWQTRGLVLGQWRLRRKPNDCPCLSGAPVEEEENGWAILRTSKSSRASK